MTPYVAQLTHEERRARRQEMCDAVLKGERQADVARRFGVVLETVKVATRGLALRPRQEPSVSSWRIVAELQNTTKTMAAIATEFGVAPQRVDQVLAKAMECGIRFSGRRAGKGVMPKRGAR